jgi:uncharacterized Zn finger protein
MPDMTHSPSRCEKCGDPDAVLPSLVTSEVQYWRCFRCGWVWATPLPKRRSDLDDG